MDDLESGRWQSNPGFALLHAAKDWGYKPSDLGLCTPEEDLLYMVAYTVTVSDMEAVERKESKPKE